MTAQDLLQPYGITSAADLHRKADLTRQRAWQIWSGRTGVGARSAKKIHDKLGVPYELLLSLTNRKTDVTHSH